MPITATNTVLTYNDLTLQTSAGGDTLYLAETVVGGNSSVSLTGGTWTVRRLTNVANNLAGASHNNVTWTTTLPAGTFLINANATTSNTSDGQFSNNVIRLRDTTNNLTYITGIGGRTMDAEFSFARSNTNLVGLITLFSSTSFQLQHWASITVGGGFTSFAGLSPAPTDTYASMIITRVG